MDHEGLVIFWFRRDLRLHDNHGFYKALTSGHKVLPLFIFDTDILDTLPKEDKRLVFIHRQLSLIQKAMQSFGGLSFFHGKPVEIMESLINKYKVNAVYTNHDYEPYAIRRDLQVSKLLSEKGIDFHTFKDQVLFEKSEVVKSDGSPYVVFTPYSRVWLKKMSEQGIPEFPSEKHLSNLKESISTAIPSLTDLGFKNQDLTFPSVEIDASQLKAYAETRNYPGVDNTTRLGMHLRFGSISVRDCIRAGVKVSSVWLSELIWREFFMQILWHFPHVEKSAFRPAYDRIEWLNNPDDFDKWCKGKTGFPMVDAGMRELNETGFMHNRVRMVVAGFLTKHLLIDWKWGEAWFAEKLLDFELSSNNGNWQWAAGSGCDAAPYFRIFNPSEQLKKFDRELSYVRRWLPEYDSPAYPKPMIDHAFARQRCLSVYAQSLKP